MSQSAVGVFLNSVSRDNPLAEEFDNLLARAEDRAVSAEQVVELAARKGFEFTTRELKVFLAAGMPLEEMESLQKFPEAFGPRNVDVEIDGIAFEIEPGGYILFS